MANVTQNIDTVKLDISIKLLKQYVNDSSIEPLISILEVLKKDPDNESILEEFINTFTALGIVQGAVLTYAPYLTSLLSNDLFEDN